MRRFIYGLVSCLVVAGVLARSHVSFPHRHLVRRRSCRRPVKVRNIDGSIAVIPATTTQLRERGDRERVAERGAGEAGEMTGSVMSSAPPGAATSGTCGDKGHKQARDFSPLSFFSRRHQAHGAVHASRAGQASTLDLETGEGPYRRSGRGGNVEGGNGERGRGDHRPRPAR